MLFCYLAFFYEHALGPLLFFILVFDFGNNKFSPRLETTLNQTENFPWVVENNSSFRFHDGLTHTLPLYLLAPLNTD